MSFNSNKVSIVLTSYNQKEKLKRAFNSLFNQTYKNIEIIIVDDCSTDNESQDYIKDIAAQHPQHVKYHLQEKNVGIPKNKNTGFKMATGDFITYLDGDDYYLPNKIEAEIKLFLEDSEIDVVYSNFRMESESGEFISNWCSGDDLPPEGDIFEQVIQRKFPKGILYRFELMKTEVLKKIDFYDPNIKAYHDWDSRIRYSEFCKIAYCNAVTSVYVQDDKGISKRTKQASLLQEMEVVYRKNWHLLVSKERVAAKTHRKEFYKNIGELLSYFTVFSDAPKLYLRVARYNTPFFKVLFYKVLRSFVKK